MTTTPAAPLTTCPAWCSEHTDPGHPEDERHIARWDGGVLQIELSQYLRGLPQDEVEYAPGIEATFVTTVRDDRMTAEQLRKLALAATAAADQLDSEVQS